MEYTITSKDNKLIKYIKSLNQRKTREEDNKFFIEGVKIIAEALKENASISQVIICPDIIEKVSGGKRLIDDIKNKIAIESVPEKVFKSISDTETPQGVIAIISNEKKRKKLESKGFYLILDEIQDPGNIGTIIRTADATGIDGVFLTKGCTDPYSPKALRASMGSIFRVQVFQEKEIVSMISEMKKSGITVLASSLDAEKSFYDIDYKKGIAVIMGNESRGVSKELIGLSDSTLKIPMRQGIESLNVSVAASILMYEKFRNHSINQRI